MIQHLSSFAKVQKEIDKSETSDYFSQNRPEVQGNVLTTNLTKFTLLAVWREKSASSRTYAGSVIPSWWYIGINGGYGKVIDLSNVVRHKTGRFDSFTSTLKLL